METLLKLNDISKKYGPNLVLDSVSLEVGPGEIHGLVGENGAGKSTLLKILTGNSEVARSGFYRGQVYLQGEEVRFTSPAQALSRGIGMVYQEFALIPGMSAAANIYLGREQLYPWGRRLLGEKLAPINQAACHSRARELLQSLGLNVDPQLVAELLPVGLKQFVELAREVSRENLKLLVLDEPTSALGQEDARRLMSVLREMAARGTGIIFVSHRLEEVISLCDRITVLRDGRVQARFSAREASCSPVEIARAMVGRSVESSRYRREDRGRGVLLSLRDFSVEMPGEPLHEVNLDIRQGEILGLAGLSGHGKSALGNGVLGLAPATGEIRLEGELLDPGDTARVIARGIHILPDERRRNGLLLNQSVWENIIFGALQQKNRFLRPMAPAALRLLDQRQARQWAGRLVKEMDIRASGLNQKVRFLSGGNQQKVCLARVLSLEPRLLFINEPTRGIDVGARQRILQTLVRVNQEQGVTLVCSSSDLDELKMICDRIAVFYEGRLFGVYPARSPDEELALAISGERWQENVCS